MKFSNSYFIAPIGQAFLYNARTLGLDDQDQNVVRLTAKGGEPLRDQLRRAHPGESIILASYCPFQRRGPFREYGPIYVGQETGKVEWELIFTRNADVRLNYFPSQIALRAYDHAGEIGHAAIVESALAMGEVESFLELDSVAFVDARFAAHGCFAARFERMASADDKLAVSGVSP